MTYYTVGKPTTTWYGAVLVAIRTWLSLANQDLKTWARLKELGLTTWKKLSVAREGGTVTFYYAVPLPSTTYYEVNL